MNLLEYGGVSGYHLELAYLFHSISPASVVPERAFSAAAYVDNKLQSRTMGNLISLRFYFLDTH